MELDATVTALAPGLLRLALGLTGNRADAEDLVQEALSALVRYWRRSGPPASPVAFACTVVRRQACRVGHKARVLVPLDEAGERADRSSLPDDAMQHSRHLVRALTALGEMEPGDREAILLVAAAGMQIDEAAAVMGISVPACKMRIHRARRRLVKAMETDDGREAVRKHGTG